VMHVVKVWENTCPWSFGLLRRYWVCRLHQLKGNFEEQKKKKIH
jgi:hypothetical protein